ATEGARNDTLNRAAFSLGTLVAGGELDKRPVEVALLSAAISIGLTEFEARATIKSGMEAGALEPRTAPKGYIGTEQASTTVSVIDRPKKDCTDPVPLPDELTPVATFDLDLLPEAIRPWVEDIAERLQCPPDYVAAGAMTSLAAVLGRKIGIRPQARTDWTVTPNLWGLVVGRPGVLKSPALEAALAPIKRLAAKSAERHAEDMAEYEGEALAAKLRAEAAEKAARKKLKEDPDADLSAVLTVPKVYIPTQKRYIASDSTPEALGELLRQNPDGLLVYRDELVSLLKGLDREDRAEGRGFYLTAWNGDSCYTFDRIGRGFNLHIPAVCLSILGSTQPGRLSEYIGHAVRGGAGDDGLVQRFGLLVWPDTSGTWKDVDRVPDSEAKNRAFQVYERLDNLDPASIGAEQDKDFNGEPEGIPYLRLSPGGIEVFQEWRSGLEVKLRSGDLHPALESHLAKYRKLVSAVALLSHLADGGTGPVTEPSVVRALAWAEYLETHARRAYASITQSEVTAAKAILRKISHGDLATTFTARDIQRKGWAGLTERRQVKAALDMLSDFGWIEEEMIETGGRPKTIYYYRGEKR
ncbi:MAG: YfjI family protein, partial [Thermodesulfobacteriota bacterium]